jgi:hypothetical protein
VSLLRTDPQNLFRIAPLFWANWRIAVFEEVVQIVSISSSEFFVVVRGRRGRAAVYMKSVFLILGKLAGFLLRSSFIASYF